MQRQRLQAREGRLSGVVRDLLIRGGNLLGRDAAQAPVLMYEAPGAGYLERAQLDGHGVDVERRGDLEKNVDGGAGLATQFLVAVR